MRRFRGLMVAAGAMVAGVAVAPVAYAEPGIPGTGPDTHCQSYGLGNIGLACDGPIDPDGSWRRCDEWQPYPVNTYGGFTPGGRACYTVEGTDPHFGLPPGHIDG